MVQRLADAKAELVPARTVGPAILVAADTTVVLDGQILGKPRSTDDARHMLELFSGRTHSVITGVTLIRLPEMERRQFVETTLVTFAALSDEQISRYLSTDEPYDKAGAYAIQGHAGRFIPRIEGCYFNVVGLPLARLVSGSSRTRLVGRTRIPVAAAPKKAKAPPSVQGAFTFQISG